MPGLNPKALFVGAALTAFAAASAIAATAPPPKPPQPTAADWRAPDPAHTMVIDTNNGRIVLELYPTIAPI